MLSLKEASAGVWKTKAEIFLEKKLAISTPALNLREIEEKQKNTGDKYCGSF